jgi:hypothetical protein
MKKYILLIICAMLSFTTYAQDYRFDDNKSSKWEQTDFTYLNTDGKVYPILINKENGRCAIEVTRVTGPKSKTPGKEYKTKKYLSEEQSKDICIKKGRNYTYKKSK